MDNETTGNKYEKLLKREKIIFSVINISIMAIGFSLLLFVLSLVAKI